MSHCFILIYYYYHYYFCCLFLSQLYLLLSVTAVYYIYIYIYAFSRRFYPKRLTVHSGYTCFYHYENMYYLNFFSLRGQTTSHTDDALKNQSGKFSPAWKIFLFFFHTTITSSGCRKPLYACCVLSSSQTCTDWGQTIVRRCDLRGAPPGNKSFCNYSLIPLTHFTPQVSAFTCRMWMY